MALFPPVNPISAALIVQPFLSVLSTQERRAASAQIAIYSFTICLFSAVLGGVFFKFFGISIPVVQIAGGVLICRMGWNILSVSDSGQAEGEKNIQAKTGILPEKVKSMLFFPLAFPVTAGSGTISVVLTLSANAYSEDLTVHAFNTAAIIAASVIICTMVFLSYTFATRLLQNLSDQTHQILNKLSGFLNFCVGLQIAVNGVLALAHSF